MGFDRDQPGPIMDPKKTDTKNNIFMVIGIVVFFLIAAWFVWRVAAEPPQSADEVEILP